MMDCSVFHEITVSFCIVHKKGIFREKSGMQYTVYHNFGFTWPIDTILRLV